MNLLGPEQLQDVEARLAQVLDRLGRDPAVAQLVEALRHYVLCGGKRIRPQLCLWTLRNARGEPAAESTRSASLELACGWELFHAFLLIHDDLIDQADLRRGQPSLHRRLQAMAGGDDKSGRDLAIVAGDLLFSLAMRIFHEVELPAELYRRQLRLFSHVACVTGYGQAVDICQAQTPLAEVDESTLLKGYHWKTAAYTFEGPMVCGGILGGLPDAALEALSRFGLALGKAYQLQNDLIDLSVPAREGCDLVQRKRTITLVRARAALSEERRQWFDRQFDALASANGHGVQIAEALRREVILTDAPCQTRALIDSLLSQARQDALCEALPGCLASGLRGLLDQLREQCFSPT